MRISDSRKKAPVRILLTGFGRFHRFKKNPTEAVVRGLDVKGLEALVGTPLRIKKVILPVHTGAFKALGAPTRGTHFDIILHLGLHSTDRVLRLERTSRNFMQFRKPDNRGDVVRGKKISPRGPARLRSNMPWGRTALELKKAGIMVAITNNAGGYICNFLYYSSLRKFSGRGTLVGFVHVPRTKFLSLGRQTKAVRTILATVVKVVRKDH